MTARARYLRIQSLERNAGSFDTLFLFTVMFLAAQRGDETTTGSGCMPPDQRNSCSRSTGDIRQQRFKVTSPSAGVYFACSSHRQALNSKNHQRCSGIATRNPVSAGRLRRQNWSSVALYVAIARPSPDQTAARTR